MLGLIIFWFIFGAIAGYIARFLMPGPDPDGFHRHGRARRGRPGVTVRANLAADPVHV